MGGVNGPQNIYLLARGLKTFELRMQRHNENGLAVAEFLETHPRVEKVFYPGLESHRDHDIASQTMRGYGGLVTFLIKDADWRADGRHRRRGEDPSHRPEPGRRRVADRTAAGDELLLSARPKSGGGSASPTT